ncbi:MAG: hypothetical protein HY589_03620 [Candidatus Omnitrophica bacterium]|nr:hypothetical protein [Candidatus Omnitrophota bacterium]
MDRMKTKALEKIEQRLENIDKDSFRYQVLQGVIKFKTSWIDLGQSLYAVWKDKLYKQWGYLTFEAYLAKEINIHKQTAIKLLRSYYFLEKEEPVYLDKSYAGPDKAAALPSYDSINVLRLAKNNKNLDEKAYEGLRKAIFEKGEDAREARKELTALIRQRQEFTPEEARKKKTEMVLKRFLSTLKSLKRDLEISKLASAGILNDTEALIKKIEGELAL